MFNLILCVAFTNTTCILLKIPADNVIFIKQVSFMLLWTTTVSSAISRRNFISQKSSVAWGVEYCPPHWGCLYCESDGQDRLLAVVVFSHGKGVIRSSLPHNSVRVWGRDAALGAQTAQSLYCFFSGLESVVSLVLLLAGPSLYIFFIFFNWNITLKEWRLIASWTNSNQEFFFEKDLAILENPTDKCQNCKTPV